MRPTVPSDITDAPKPLGQVECSLTALNSALDELDKAADMLAEKLESVIRLEPSTPEDLKCSPKEGRCPLSERLESARFRVTTKATKLEKLASLIEL